jgi:hypothetical protein
MVVRDGSGAAAKRQISTHFQLSATTSLISFHGHYWKAVIFVIEIHVSSGKTYILDIFFLIFSEYSQYV